MTEQIHITSVTDGYMNPAQRLNAELATATAKLSRWRMALGELGVLESQTQLPDGRHVESRSETVGMAIVRIMDTNGSLELYDFDLNRPGKPLIFEASSVADPERILDRYVVEADEQGIARAQEFGRILLDCIDELPVQQVF